MDDRIKEKLAFIYGPETGAEAARKLRELVDRWRHVLPEIPGPPSGGLPADETDAWMITYGDSIRTGDDAPLAVLADFAKRRLAGAVSGIHVLPFSPYSSDDGFSVMDYRQVNPALGTWDELTALAGDFRLMADLVLNHCSAQGPWFRAFLRDEEPYKDYFITVEDGTDLSAVFRPRALPLLHEFETASGPKNVWTTFSADQVDLNFADPRVFLEFADILLDYVNRGVRIVRLDAIGFLWKEIGTSCMHHPKTHAMVQLFRLLLAETAPGAILITETNVPHKENISYFGDGTDEAHMVYQFSLPPLTMDAFIRGDASKLSAWAAGLPDPDPEYSFFNFLASHDGVGVLPARGYLDQAEIDNLIAEVKRRGGLVSYKSTPQGDIPYELNVSWRDAVAEPELNDADRAAKFLASQAVMLVLAGVPGIYVHSILGSGNWAAGPKETGMNRSINREKLGLAALEAELDDPGSLRGRIFSGYAKLLAARRSNPAFHPASAQEILDMGPGVFALRRTPPWKDRGVTCLQSVSAAPQTVPCPDCLADKAACDDLSDLITGRDVALEDCEDGRPGIRLAPWEVLWLSEG